MIKLIRYLQQISSFKFIALGTFSILLAPIVVNIISINSQEPPIINNKTLIKFIKALFICPLFETILFQALPFVLIQKVVKHKYSLCIYLLISTITFMLIHPFVINYMIFTFIAGFILAFLYYVATFKKESAIILVSLIHFSYNFITFILYVFQCFNI